jgi:hypothetical protein
LTLFQLSRPGLLFLAKQQLLQTGNTFEFTRALNPAFVVANAVPFLHIKRNLRPLKELTGKTDTSYANVRTMGQLQNGTYNKLKSKSIVPFILLSVGVPPTPSSRSFLGNLGSSLLSPLKSLKDTVTGTLSAFNPFQKRNVGELKDNWGPSSWVVSRPELVTYVKQMQISHILNQKKALNDTITVSGIRTGAGAGATTDVYSDFEIIPVDQKIIRFIKYFDPGQSLSTGVPGTDKPNSYVAKRGRGYLPENGGKRLSYIKDPSNIRNSKPSTQVKVQTPYKPIPAKFDDIINVSFAMGKNDPIQFRAFIKDLVEVSSPQYQQFQYIGRIEKFVNYTGVQREISFKLSVIAFGDSELNTAWRRINYLTGMVFPYGFTRGIMQPNIVRLTIGNLYMDQPGYISALSTNFNEPAESWEISQDRQVPIGATMDIKFTLIEKATKIAESPFYGITEEMKDSSAQRFNKTINIPKPLNTNIDVKGNPPTINPLLTKVDSVRSAITQVNPAVAVRADVNSIRLPADVLNIPDINLNKPQPPLPFGG